MRKIGILVAAFILISAVFLSASGKSEEIDEIYVAFSFGAEWLEIYQSMEDMLLRAADESGGDIKFQFWYADGDEEKESLNIDKAIASKPDILVLMPQNARQILTHIEHANVRKIPVIIYNRQQASHETIRPEAFIGLQYNLEVVNRFEQFIMNTAGEAVDFINEIGSPALKILLDTFHMNIEEDSMTGAIETAGGLLGHFHMGENNRRPPGTGNFPWKELFASLKRTGYDGWAVMEPFLKPGGEVGRDISVYRDIMPGADQDVEAEKSCRFIKNIIEEL